MTRPLAGVVAAALAVAALGGCTHSSGGTVSAPTAAPTTGRASVSTAPSASLSSSRATPPGHSLTAIAPIRPLTCPTLPHSLGTFRPGGQLPSGVPLPQAVPTLKCTAGGGSVALVWASISQAQYQQELTGTGWSAAGGSFTKPHAPRTIRLASVHGDLVAVFRPR